MCKELTPNQEAYARGVLFEKKTKRQAYRDAYPNTVNSNDETIDSAIWRLEKNERFCLGFATLRAEAEQAMNITRDDVLRELSSIGFADTHKQKISVKDKIQALALISKILGYEQKQAVDINLSQKPKIIYHAPDNGRGHHE